jgi:CHAD domain-containing protein
LVSPPPANGSSNTIVEPPTDDAATDATAPTTAPAPEAPAEPAPEPRAPHPLDPVRDRVLALVTDVETALAGLKHPAVDPAPASGDGASAGESTAAPRDDAEAIHDFRVALRRLRSCLRPLGLAWGRRKTEAISDEIAAIAARTNDLRDEEVLRETLAELAIPGEARAALARWMVGRARREDGLRARVLRGLKRTGALHETLDAVRARLDKPPKHEMDPASLAREALDRAMHRVADRSRGAASRDGPSMHRLRIAVKRLRYTAELMDGFCDADFARIEKHTAKLQKRLGHLNDLDQARQRMTRALGLARPARFAVLAAIDAEREAVGRRCDEDVHHEVQALAKAVHG